MNAVNNIASYLPPKVRATVYTVLAALILLETVWDILPQPFEGKILASLSILGFGMAAVNATPPATSPLPPDDGGVPPQFEGEFP
jgi:hypothetical protein